MSEELTPANESITLAQKTWLLNELARTDNRPELKNKYKRIFGKVVPDIILASLSSEYASDIAELKQSIQGELDTHKFSSSYKRMDEYEEILDLCKNGYEIGYNEFGPIIKKDAANALAALREMRMEKQTQVQNDLKLLQILVQSNNLKTKVSGDNTDSEVTDHLEEESTVVTVQSDNDKFFPDSNQQGETE